MVVDELDWPRIAFRTESLRPLRRLYVRIRRINLVIGCFEDLCVMSAAKEFLEYCHHFIPVTHRIVPESLRAERGSVDIGPVQSS